MGCTFGASLPPPCLLPPLPLPIAVLKSATRVPSSSPLSRYLFRSSHARNVTEAAASGLLSIYPLRSALLKGGGGGCVPLQGRATERALGTGIVYPTCGSRRRLALYARAQRIRRRGAAAPLPCTKRYSRNRATRLSLWLLGKCEGTTHGAGRPRSRSAPSF